ARMVEVHDLGKRAAVVDIWRETREHDTFDGPARVVPRRRWEDFDAAPRPILHLASVCGVEAGSTGRVGAGRERIGCAGCSRPARLEAGHEGGGSVRVAAAGDDRLR